MGNGKNIWIVDHFRRVGEGVCQYSKDKTRKDLFMGYGYAFLGKAQEWFEVMYEHGGLGPIGKTFNGGTGGSGAADLDRAADWHHEHELYCSYTMENVDIGVAALKKYGRYE